MVNSGAEKEKEKISRMTQVNRLYHPPLLIAVISGSPLITLHHSFETFSSSLCRSHHPVIILDDFNIYTNNSSITLIVLFLDFLFFNHFVFYATLPTDSHGHILDFLLLLLEIPP